MDNAKLGFVEGIEVVDGKDDSVRTVTRIIINVQRELGKRMYDRPVIILTVEEWDALQAERKAVKNEKIAELMEGIER